jgi:hypothetical protein
MGFLLQRRPHRCHHTGRGATAARPPGKGRYLLTHIPAKEKKILKVF